MWQDWLLGAQGNLPMAHLGLNLYLSLEEILLDREIILLNIK